MTFFFSCFMIIFISIYVFLYLFFPIHLILFTWYIYLFLIHCDLDVERVRAKTEYACCPIKCCLNWINYLDRLVSFVKIRAKFMLWLVCDLVHKLNTHKLDRKHYFLDEDNINTPMHGFSYHLIDTYRWFTNLTWLRLWKQHIYMRLVRLLLWGSELE